MNNSLARVKWICFKEIEHVRLNLSYIREWYSTLEYLEEAF
jgi:hypothetical protein